MELFAIIQVAITILGINLTMQFMLWVELRWQGRQKDEYHRELLMMVYKLAKLQMKASRGAGEVERVLDEIAEEEVKLLSRGEVDLPGDPPEKSDV